MMMSVGYEVYHYGVEGSESDAVNIDLLSREEWEELYRVPRELVEDLLNAYEADRLIETTLELPGGLLGSVWSQSGRSRLVTPGIRGGVGPR